MVVDAPPGPSIAEGRRSGLNEPRTLLGIGSDILRAARRGGSACFGRRRRAKRRAAAMPPRRTPPILPLTPTMMDLVSDAAGMLVIVSIKVSFRIRGEYVLR
jgi:hypothetical protein